jgi:hypothetical protein
VSTKLICSFSLLAQRKRTKRKGTSHLFAFGEFPVLLEPAGSLKTRFAQTVQTPFSAVSAVLGCMTMEKYAKLSFAGSTP